MKKTASRLLPILLIALLLLSPASADQDLFSRLSGFNNQSTAAADHYIADGRLSGSCQLLRGDVELAVVLVDLEGATWGTQDVNQVHLVVEDALDNLEAEAAAMGVRLSITPNYYRGHGSSDPDETDWELSVLSTVPALASRSRTAWFNKPILFCLNTEGRSFAITTFKQENLEYVVFYMENDESTVRHELLHLFGAEDLYFHPEIESAAERHFPDSVMLHSNKDAVVDPLTAWLIGWTAEPGEVALAFLQDTEHLTAENIEDARSTDMQTGTGSFDMGDGWYYGSLDMGSPNGRGYYVWDGGYSYVGDWVWNAFTGRGTYTWDDGEYYTGDFVNDDCTGKGTYIWNDGDYYTGDFVQDKRTGKGTYIWNDGDYYTGDFIDGDRTGRGTSVWADGESYTGDFIDDDRTGKGTYSWKDGDSYTGDYVNGERTGKGAYSWSDGDCYTGDFVHNERTGLGVFSWADGDVYVGGFADGECHGKGAYTWTSGESYVGDYVDGKRTGSGVLTWASGAVYTGEFVDGARTGTGVCIWPDGSSYTGEWLNGAITGHGMKRDANGDVYIGEFLNGDPHGVGTLYSADGTVHSGVWNYGELVSE